MINEDFCSYEVAKLLKEKGFDEPCYRWYDTKGEVCAKFINPDIPLDYSSREYYLCPTHQMAMKWLREVHKINIEIHYNRFGENYKYLIIYKPEVLDDIRSLGVYFHYEETVEAALKYVLEYLI